MPNEEILPKGFNMDGMTKRRKTVVLQTGVENKTFQDERHPLVSGGSSRPRGPADWVH